MSFYTCVPAAGGRRCATHLLPLYFHDDRCCFGYCLEGQDGHERQRARDAMMNALEPDGSYSLCWKRVYPDDPASHRCVLPPGHTGPCSEHEVDEAQTTGATHDGIR